MASFVAKLLSGALPLFGNMTTQQTNGIKDLTAWQNLPAYLGHTVSRKIPIIRHTNANRFEESMGFASISWGYGASKTPITNVTRKYNFEIARTTLAPDGYEKEMIVINGQYPGPLIEANWGDWVEITVINSIVGPEEGTAIHWHALGQKDTPWADGVPGVSQCPIAPGSNYTYRFLADHVGTSFYHSHYSAQISAGAAGPIVFYGPKSRSYDVDLGPVLLSDYWHPAYTKLVEGIMGVAGVNKAPAFSDNNMINGRMNYDCSLVKDGTPCVSNAGINTFQFQEGKDHLLRVINGGSAGLQYFTVDDHELEVISMDYVPIKPYKTNYITLGVGQRSDVIVKGKTGAKAKQAYFMRGNLSANCALPRQPYSLAAIYYNSKDAASRKLPTSKPQVFTESRLNCSNEALKSTVPATVSPVKTPDKVITIQVLDTLNATHQEEYLENNQTFRVNYNQPILKVAEEGNKSLDPNWNVYSTGNSSVVRIVWENQKVDPSDPAFYNLTFAHAMHLHGHDFQVLHEGSGEWDGTVTNPKNPLRRDTHMLPPNGHLAVQFETDNPGIWPFHCHVAWHVSAGFAIMIMERPHDLEGRLDIKNSMPETCTDWEGYTANHVVDQIDSGLRMMERVRGIEDKS